MCPDTTFEAIDTGEVVVTRVQGFLEADAVLAALRANGIVARARGDATGEIYGLTLDGIGLTEILVPAEQAETAHALLAAAARGELALTEDDEESALLSDHPPSREDVSHGGSD